MRESDGFKGSLGRKAFMKFEDQRRISESIKIRWREEEREFVWKRCSECMGGPSRQAWDCGSHARRGGAGDREDHSP